jgi:glucose-1-phosphate adenylyltransferase
MDLRAVSPELNLYNRQWPLRTAGYFDAPAKFVFDEEGRRGMAVDSIIAGSSIVSGAYVARSVLGRGVRIHTGAVVEDSVIFDNCDVGRHAKVRKAILDKNVKIPENTRVGYDLEGDRKKWHVTESGIVVIEGHRSTVDISVLQV